MHSRSAATKAAQAAERSGSSQDDDSSKRKITFNIGSNRNGRKRAASELVTTNSDTDYPNSGSSAGVGKAPSQSLRSSQDTTCTNETEPSNVSLSLPSSGSSITYNAMKNSLTQECGSETEQLTFDSPEGVVGRLSRTSTPQKRRLQQKSDSDSRSTLQIIAEEVPVNSESNSDEIIESSQIDTVRIMSEDDNLDIGITKRKRKDSDLSDSQLPNTLITVPPKKCRQSVEIIGVHNKKSCPTPVVDLDDESDDDSNRLYLSQSQSQTTHSMSQSENLLRLSQQITPIVVDVEEEAVSSKGNLLPSSPSRQNGNSFTHNSSLNIANTLPLMTNKSLHNYTPKDYLLDDDVSFVDMPSSQQTFARVKGNLSLPSRSAMASPRVLARIGNAPRLNSSTPSSAEVVHLDSDGQNTPENTNGTSINAEDSVTTYHSVVVLVNYSLTVNPVTQSYRRELVDYSVQDAIAPKAMLPPSLDDVSPGALADVSGQSKAASVASVTSTGLFPLPPARQSMVSTISSASATSAASLQEKLLLKSYSGPNSLKAFPNVHNKFNNFDKSTEKDLKIDMCISDKQLTRLESMISFESPMASKSPPKRTGPTTNGEVVLSSAAIELPSEQHRDKLISPALDESLPTTETASSGLLNGSDVHPDPPSPDPPSAAKSRKKSKSVKKTAAKPTATKPAEEPCPETPKSSTKKRGPRARPARKQAASSRKAKMSPIVEVVPPVKEVTPKEKKARVPPARKGLILSPKPVPVEKPTRRTATALAVEEVTSDDLLDPLITPEQPIMGFARWTDKRYYSCTIIGRTKDAKFNIKFDDGKSKCLPEEFVIPVGQLRKGLSVFAQVEGGAYESGRISELKVEGKDCIVMYMVELDSKKSVEVPRSALFLTEDQALVLQEETWGYSSPSCQTRRPADVSLDNMVGGKRRRGFASVIRRLPKVSGENRPPPTPTPYSDTSDDVNYATEDIFGIDVEFYPLPYPSLKDGGLSKAAGKVKGRGKDVATEKTTDMQLNELLGPIPEPGCKLFAGMQFLFTSVSTPTDNNPLGQLNESTYDSATSDGESVCRIPLFKERLVAQLEAGGGVVYDRFEQLEGYTDTYLIASAPCQTAKYLLCLAHRIPVISHDWVISSIKAMKRPPVTRYLLQAGRDIINGYRVDQKTRASRDLILRNVDVLIVSEVDHFIGFWTKVLEAVGARVSSLSPDSDERPKETDVYVVLSDNSIVGSKMRTWADNFGVRIVNPEWVKYCLIKSAKGDINLEQFSIELY